jgi:hypothetical protein
MSKLFAYRASAIPNEGHQDREHQGPSFEGPFLVAGARFVPRYHYRSPNGVPAGLIAGYAAAVAEQDRDVIRADIRDREVDTRIAIEENPSGILLARCRRRA